MGSPIIKRERKKDKWVMSDSTSTPRRRSKSSPLDSLDVLERKNQILEWRRQARMTQAKSRYEMAKDQDYYDGIQWDEVDKQIVEDRSQTASVFNLTAVTIRWITGTEKRTRVDFRVMPRSPEARKAAENKTSLLKYLSDVNKDQFERSKAFQDAVIVGLGWLEDGIRGDSEEEPLFCGYESWRNIWYDQLSIKADLSDARFQLREKWIDLDVALLMFPDRKAELEAAASNIISISQTNLETGNPYLYSDVEYMGTLNGTPGDMLGCGTRKRVCLCEAWYRVPQKVKMLRQEGAVYNGVIFNPVDPVHTWAIDNNLASTYDSIKMTMNLMILSISGNGGTVLQNGPSPYWHNRFPFTPIWAYRRGRDNAPYGVVRGLRDPQDDLNKRRSKALYLLNSKQVVAEKGAVDDIDLAMDEIARPDGYVEINIGKRFDIQEQANLAKGHIQLMDQDAKFIQEAGGVTDENLGRQTNAISGKAIESRQNQGYTTTSDIFDNYRLAIQLTGERRLSLIEQYYDQPKQMRLSGERKSDVQFVHLNDPGGLNPITADQADFVVDEQDFRGTQRQAMFDTMLEMTSKLPPEVGLKLLTITFEASDIPMRDEFVKVLRDITGMKDPNVEEDPQAAAAQQVQAAQRQQAQMVQQQQQQQAMDDQRAKFQAEIALINGKAQEAVARGSKEQLNALLVKLEALAKSMDLASHAAADPAITGAADQILSDVNAVPTFGEQPHPVYGQQPVPQQIISAPSSIPNVNNIAPPLPPGVQ